MYLNTVSIVECLLLCLGWGGRSELLCVDDSAKVGQVL